MGTAALMEEYPKTGRKKMAEPGQMSTLSGRIVSCFLAEYKYINLTLYIIKCYHSFEVMGHGHS